MKKFSTILFVITLFLVGQLFCSNSTFSADKQQITNNLDDLVQAVNAGDTQRISALISPSNEVLQSDIQERIRGGIAYQLDYSPFDRNVEIISQDQVKVKARFVASGVGWNVSGLSTFFVINSTFVWGTPKVTARLDLKPISSFFAWTFRLNKRLSSSSANTVDPINERKQKQGISVS